MRTIPHHVCAAALLLLGACEQSAVKGSESLVGAKQLSSSRMLSREIIYISRGYGSSSPGRLSYELRPDDTLTVTFAAWNWKAAEETEDKETFHLAPQLAAQTRRVLWRMRPEKLQGIEWVDRPVDCPPPPTDTMPEAAVAFIAEGPKPGVEDDRVGVFNIPYGSTCNSKQAVQARNLIQSALRSFPPSNVAAEFERRKKRIEAGLSDASRPPLSN